MFYMSGQCNKGKIELVRHSNLQPQHQQLRIFLLLNNQSGHLWEILKDNPIFITNHVIKYINIERPRVIANLEPNAINGQYSLAVRTPQKINSVIDILNKEHLNPLKKYHFKGVKELCLGIITLNAKDCKLKNYK
jgi:hypothetical protein